MVDIGGGSTELAAGTGATADVLHSLQMGCVTWLERYFNDRNLTQENFDRAGLAAREMLLPVVDSLKQHGWQICVGASGTVQALQEIMVAQGMDERITLNKLLQMRQRAIQCGKLEELEIEGLTLERALVFPSGLSILIAIFETLEIESMTLSGGALREGLVYGMLDLPVEQDIRSRTIRNIQRRYQLDIEQAERVSLLAESFVLQLSKSWQIDSRSAELLHWACLLHEVGLSVDFKQSTQHAAYLIRNIDLPGFTPAQKKLLAALLQNQNGMLDMTALSQQNAVPQEIAHRLCRILRLAIIFASRRRDDTMPLLNLKAEGDKLHVVLPAGWLQAPATRGKPTSGKPVGKLCTLDPVGRRNRISPI